MQFFYLVITGKELPICFDGKYFKIEKRKSDTNVDVNCILCEKNIKKKSVSAAINGTSNLARHIRNYHASEIDAFDKHIKNKKILKESMDGKIQTKLTNLACTEDKVDKI